MISLTADPSPWLPVLAGDLRTRAIASVESIASALLEPKSLPTPNASLGGGLAGISLFLSYFSFAHRPGSERHSERALELLSRSIDSLAEQRQSPSLYAGFTGIAWVVEHLQGRLFAPPEEDLNAEIDDALLEYLAQSPWRRDYDLISGLVGYALYALDRKGHPSASVLLERAIDRLGETAVREGDGLGWHTPSYLLPQWQRGLYSNGYYNLGLAHGVPGIIAVLGQACGAGVAVGKARPLVDGAVRWLGSKRNPRGSESSFATLVSREGEESNPKPSRLAWCYGDLGISAALLWAARSVNEFSWEREALDIARRAAGRSLGGSGVIDAGLCHGAAGNAHVFNRLYQATREQVFLDAARAWFERTLALRRPGEGVGGFLAWRGLDNKWEEDPGLLEGAAGIGLALLAAVSDVQPDWDRMLMVAIPPR